MPFKQVNAKDELQRKLETDPEFQNVWEGSRDEYVRIGQMNKSRKQDGAQPIFQIQNYCKPDGKCSRCGDCCRGDSLPITEAEAAKIAEYIKKHNIKPVPRPIIPTAQPSHYMRCPFLSDVGCQIYPARPLICRHFICSDDLGTVEAFKLKRIRDCHGEADMWRTFYG